MIKYSNETILKYKNYTAENGISIADLIPPSTANATPTAIFSISTTTSATTSTSTTTPTTIPTTTPTTTPALIFITRNDIKYDNKKTKNWTKSHNNNQGELVIEVITSGPNAWKVQTSNKDDSKLIIGILNKLTLINFEKMIQETRLLNYNTEKIIDIIFTKSVLNINFSELYAEYCKQLDLEVLINSLCLDQFTKKKSKNLCKFIGALYKIGVIKSIQAFIEFFTNDLSETNLEFLLELIKTVGPKKEEFKQVLEHLNSIKGTFITRLKFAIMDITDEANS